ncbi:hypothetical protein RLEG12_22710 [Rhizobium leguminosarum bv. trifolii CB782]|nr:hypothetical protein RLEG12_22710 [Rhizobium leguminosarum bv. trifolii CB782]
MRSCVTGGGRGLGGFREIIECRSRQTAVAVLAKIPMLSAVDGDEN